ncbi:hypothetical protein MHH57_12600 [Paenibacillus sp. FSL H7-0442]|uniref:hypothetical protein n=1 Tax=Paenibacillus TaxID=44249 RepID=UPI003159656A
MKIYERDYTYLTDEELKLWDEKKEAEKVGKLGGSGYAKVCSESTRKLHAIS